MGSFGWTYLHWFEDNVFVFCAIGAEDGVKLVNRILGKTKYQQDLRPGKRGIVAVLW
jgi:hypothetical protein